jgi:DNA gyrase subunit A
VVVGACVVEEGKDLLTVTKNGFGKRTALEEYHPQNRGGKGLKNYNLTEKTGPVAGVAVVDDSDDIMLIENGGVIIRMPADGTKTAQMRGGKGLKNYNITDKTGLVAGCRVVAEDDDVMLIENGGVIIRVPAASINVYKRDVQGVIVMRLEEGNQVVSVERIDKVAEDA